MAQKTGNLLALAAVALVGGAIGYAISDQKQPKKTKKKDVDIPPEPPGPGPVPLPGEGTGPSPGTGGYRPPMPQTAVSVPSNMTERKALDDTICEAVVSFAESPEPGDVVLATLEAWAPDGEWPAVPGDHPTMHALQAMVSMRVEQIATDLDPSKSAEENFKAFCPAEPHILE